MSHSKKNQSKPTAATQPQRKTTTTAGSPVPGASVNANAGKSSAPSQPYTVQARSTTVEAKPGKAQITANAIAEAAYFLWLQRGGNETVNWLEAEASLRAKV